MDIAKQTATAASMHCTGRATCEYVLFQRQRFGSILLNKSDAAGWPTTRVLPAQVNTFQHGQMRDIAIVPAVDYGRRRQRASALGPRPGARVRRSFISAYIVTGLRRTVEPRRGREKIGMRMNQELFRLGTTIALRLPVRIAAAQNDSWCLSVHKPAVSCTTCSSMPT